MSVFFRGNYNHSEAELKITLSRIYLQDITVNPGYALTGISFVNFDKFHNFSLAIKMTEVNYMTGKLGKSEWKYQPVKEPR